MLEGFYWQQKWKEGNWGWRLSLVHLTVQVSFTLTGNVYQVSRAEILPSPAPFPQRTWDWRGNQLHANYILNTYNSGSYYNMHTKTSQLVAAKKMHQIIGILFYWIVYIGILSLHYMLGFWKHRLVFWREPQSFNLYCEPTIGNELAWHQTESASVSGREMQYPHSLS